MLVTLKVACAPTTQLNPFKTTAKILKMIKMTKICTGMAIPLVENLVHWYRFAVH